jgi:hypothetical protein
MFCDGLIIAWITCRKLLDGAIIGNNNGGMDFDDLAIMTVSGIAGF